MGLRTVRVASLSLVIAAIAAGCGGGSTPTQPAPIVVPPPAPPAPQPPAPAPVLQVTRILAFGDSMTAGTTSAAVPLRLLDAGLAVSYPFKLQAGLAARYTDQTVVVLNAGKAGEVAADAATYTRFSAALSEAKPEVILLMEGANDLNAVTPSVTSTVNAMEEMVKEARRRGIVVMLATIPPQRPGPGTKTTTPAVLTRYNNEIRTMASTKNAEFGNVSVVDVNTLLPLSAIGQDGLHPTEAGYLQLAQIFFDAIKEKYEK